VTLRARALAVLAATAVVAAACTAASEISPTAPPSVSDPVGVKVAFFQDGSVESPNTQTLPAFLGMKLAFSQAIEAGGLPVVPELLGFDTGGDPAEAAEMAAEVAADPTYVAAVVGPYWQDTVGVGETLDAAGIPTLSLSILARSQGSSWFPLVAGARRQAATLAGYVRGMRGAGGVCLAGDATPYSRSMMDLLEPGLRGALFAAVTLDLDGDDAERTAATIGQSGCSTVLWTGYGSAGGELRNALTGAGAADVRLVGADATKGGAYLETSGPAADGTVVACPCVDLSASTDPAAQRFVHDYQADYATPPGIFAAEGWDAGGMLLRAFTAGAASASSVLDDLRSAPAFEGLGATYPMSSGGPPGPPSRLRLYRAEAGRWVPLGTQGTNALPLSTPGVLAVGSCRSGAPYAYRDARGHLIGFDVEFARSIARRLDLALSWTRTSCASATDPLDRGRVDVLLVPRHGLVPGTPASRAFLSTRAAVVVPRSGTGQGPSVKPESGDVVGLAASAPIPAWARRALGGAGAVLRSFRRDPRRAYGLLERGAIAAVADTEPAAWAAVEHRPRLVVAFTEDTGDDDVMVTGAIELLAAVDGALQELVDDGTYALLFGAYFPGSTLPDTVGT
jgi:branched-chain amino acid transport system substrate-binding protein